MVYWTPTSQNRKLVFSLLSFKLSDDYVAQYKDQVPPFGFQDAAGNSLGELTFVRTYSRLKDDGTKERWHEVCRRVIEGMYSIQKDWAQKNRLPWNSNKAQTSAKEAYDRLYTLKWTPPGRGLWMMGSDFVHERGIAAALYNCSFVSTGDIDRYNPGSVFGWIMDALMLGVGVGFDTKAASRNIEIRYPTKTYIVHTIPDTREGWVESVEMLINSYLRDTPPVIFDYSEIREAGLPIKGFGGTSSGHKPLMKLHAQLNEIFYGRLNTKLDSRTVVDIVNLIGTCVVAGNVRRSATIALGDPEDDVFISLKDYEKYPERAEWGWMSNNTLVIDEPGTDYEKAVKRIVDNGEPGFLWLDTMQGYGRTNDPRNDRDHRVLGTNPCAEISLESYELCNLVEVHLDRHDSMEDFLRTIKFAYLFAKTVTLLPTHWPQTNAVIQRNRRIGTSLTGIAGFVEEYSLGKFREWANEGYDEVQRYDSVYSEWLGIRQSIKTTTVKPSGSVSLLSGSTPGVHWAPAGNYYLRAIRFGNDDNMLHMFRLAGYRMEPDDYSLNTTVVYFPMHVPFSRSERDVSIYEKVHLAAEAQAYWADNAVSVTISFDPVTEGADVERVLRMYEGKLKTASFLPIGNTVYAQQPYTSITQEEYEEYEMTLFKIDWSGIYDGVDNLEAMGERYCSNDSCLI